MISTVLRALLCVILFTAPAMAGERITVMTRNLYLGADLGAVLRVADPNDLPGVVGETFAAVQASDVQGRMEAIADEIVRTRAEIVGIQEGALWRTGAFRTVAEEVAFDFIKLLRDALAARGVPYEVAAEIVNFDVQLPGLTASGLREIRLTDRDAILVRTGRGARVQWSEDDVQAANFQTNAVVLGVLPLVRGWAALDFSVDGARARFLTTHLETVSALVQMAQAQELLAGPADTELPLIFVCDCNSSADGIGRDATPTYGTLLAAGFEDAWSRAHRHASGFTCCQAADLRQPSDLTERIDFVFVRGEVDVRHARLTGADPDERTEGTQLWPSDHAGVAASLKLPHRDGDEKEYYPGPR